MKKIDWLIFVFFLFLTFFLRFPSFFQSYIEWDEGLYILVARSLIEGNPPYTTVWDNKPPGIYLLFSLALILLGNSVLSIRILTWITISTTCYFLYIFGKVFDKNDASIGLLAGVLYAIFSIRTDSLAGNTEIFIAPFVTLAFYLLFYNKSNKFLNPKISNFFIVGLLLGFGIQIKQVVIFDFTALLIILTIRLRLHFQASKVKSYFFRELLKAYAMLCFGLILPLFIVGFCFLINGHFSEYLYANFSANIVRVAGVGFSIPFFLQILAQQIYSNFILWLCLLLIPFYWFFFSKDTETEEKQNLIYLIIWFLMTFLSVCLLKGVYNHYYLQLLPPLCLISSYLIIKTVWASGELDKKRRFIALALILLNPFLLVTHSSISTGAKLIYFRFIKGINNWGDDYAIISQYLQRRIDKNDYIYAVDLPPIIYFLVEAKIPTKYAFSYFVHDRTFAKFAGVNSIRELNIIMSKKPIYVIKTFQPPQSGPTINTDYQFYAALNKYLKRNYVLETSIKDCRLYKLKEKSKNI